MKKLTILIVLLSLSVASVFSQVTGENPALEFLREDFFPALNNWSDVAAADKDTNKTNTLAAERSLMKKLAVFKVENSHIDDELTRANTAQTGWYGFFKDRATYRMPFHCQFVSAELKMHDGKELWFYVTYTVDYVDKTDWSDISSYNPKSSLFVKRRITVHDYMLVEASKNYIAVMEVDDKLPGGTPQQVVSNKSQNNNYLTFAAQVPNSTVGIENHRNNPDIQYSIDGGITWQKLTDHDSVVLRNIGDKMQLKGNNPNRFSDGFKYTKFKMTGKIAASGNIMSLIDGKGKVLSLPGSYCFYHLFYDCASLTSAPELPAVSLSDGCYSYMFQGCTSLTTAPKLPAVNITESCYESMFYNCTSLSSVPELPAIQLKKECYSYMFADCASLTSAPKLPATQLAEECYSYMFRGCARLTSAPELPATILATKCYKGMFGNCINLATAPDLPATRLATGCYRDMFEGCTSLTSASELPATYMAELCYSNMFHNCTRLSSAPKLPATQLAEGCYSDMFTNCTNLASAPDLPATNLKARCYERMFINCKRLSSAPDLPASDLAERCYKDMFGGCNSLKSINVNFSDWKYDPQKRAEFYDENSTGNWLKYVAPNGTFYCPRALEKKFDESHIPQGWTVEYID